MTASRNISAVNKVRVGLAVSRTLVLSALTVVTSAWAEEAPKNKHSAHAVLGVGALLLPEYPGSNHSKEEVLPLINLRYKRYFIGGLPGFENGLGFILHKNQQWTIAAVGQFDIDEPRKEADDVHLFGLGDIEASTRAGIYSSYQTHRYLLTATVLTDVQDNGQGTVVNLGARMTYKPTQRLHLFIGPAITWGNQEHMQTFFGIDEPQSVRSGYTPYKLDSGASHLRLSLGARYPLSPNWGVGASIMASQFLYDVADSPVIQDKNQLFYGLFLTYRL